MGRCVLASKERSLPKMPTFPLQLPQDCSLGLPKNHTWEGFSEKSTEALEQLNHPEAQQGSTHLELWGEHGKRKHSQLRSKGKIRVKRATRAKGFSGA